jgi:hypothetical protein
MLECQRLRESQRTNRRAGGHSDDEGEVSMLDEDSMADSLAELGLGAAEEDLSGQSSDSFSLLSAEDDSALSVEGDSHLNESWSPIASDRSFTTFGGEPRNQLLRTEHSSNSLLAEEPSSIICDEIHE